MKRILSLLLFISALQCASPVATAQDFSSLREGAENVVKSRRPGWKLVRKEERGKKASYVYGVAGDGLHLRIFRGGSREEAAEKMQASLKSLSSGPGRKRTDIGDEAYSWKNERDGSAGIRFRKANVYVDLVASSEEIAEDLAQSLTRLIPSR